MRETVLIVALLLLACAEPSAELRKHTYPPEFRYVTKSQISETMWQLTSQLEALERELRAPGAEVDQQAVLASLGAIADNARRLRGGTLPSNHRLLEENLDGFLDTVSRAERDAGREPPRFYLAGSVAGACSHCHGLHD